MYDSDPHRTHRQTKLPGASGVRVDGAWLAITTIMSLVTVSSPEIYRAIVGNRLVFYGLMIGELLNGLTLSVILLAYTADSIASTFAVTAAMFGAMSAYGCMTKKDLTSWGVFLFMGLIGIVIASLVNIFYRSNAVSWVVSVIGVIVFTGSTAYDTWKIKALADAGE